MPDLLIDITIKVDGVATAADALPVLRDASSTFGVRRKDTLAVVVASGTAMIAGSGTGNYRYTLTDAVAGVTYEYVAQVLVDGDEFPITGELTAVATSTLPTYVDVATARLWAAQLHLQAILDASDGDLLAKLTQATQRVDTAYRWQGVKISDTQDLEFPRIDGARFVVADGSGNAIVPMAIRMATLHEAAALFDGQRAARLAAQHEGLTSQTNGDASESYVAPVNGRGVPQLCQLADNHAKPYRLRSGGLR